jgi:primosomal protein N' (replication factor Y)
VTPFEPAYVEVAVNVPQVSGMFHYHLPPALLGAVAPGCLVVVPFGPQTVQGIVFRLLDEPEVPTTRAVLDLLDPFPVLTLAQLDLARWMAEQTLAPLAACIERMLPPGLGQHADTIFRLRETAPGGPPPEAGRSPLQARLLEMLAHRGAARGRQVDHVFPRVTWRPAMQALVRQGWVTAEHILPPPSVQPKLVRTVQLACPLPAAEEALPHLGRAGSKAFLRRQAALAFLMREPWSVDVAWVYAQTGCTLPDLQDLAERGLVALGESEVWRDPLSAIEYVPDHPLALTRAQAEVWRTVQAALCADGGGPPANFLLHGVTGSGKTEIYLHAVAETLRLGRQAIVLVPEIALTPQTVRRFMARFPGLVGLVHSRLSEGERYDTWRRARAGLLPVIVGPRSALFAPLDRLGLIVIDECHDESYYQSEQPPVYHTVRVARAYARRAGAVCLLGSATPDVITSYQAEAGRWERLSLPLRVLAHRETVARQAAALGISIPERGTEGEAASLALPKVTLVDMRQELKAGNRSIFSRALQTALGQVLEAGQQSILFLNRRGTATYVFCRDCGASLICPKCDLPLTYHAPQVALVCHHCGFQRTPPVTCPTCGSAQIRHFGAGTERVEDEVAHLFPGARTLRWDAETTREKGAHEIILAHFANHRADILVGTQMLAKGLDLPLVTLVGAVLADVGLNLPDYRASERTFQVLTQVAGRAGRSPLGGRVVLQTFQPDHYVIQAAAQQDYASFYEQEIDYRRRLRYPPFYRLVRLEYRHVRLEKAEEAAQEMARQLRGWLAAGDRRGTELIGPVPCFFGRLNGVYRWQIVLRGPDPASLLRDKPLGEWRLEVDPPNLL